MTRRLAGLERQFYQQNLVGSTNIVCSLSFDQALDSLKLKAALAELMKLHPILAADIVADPFIRFQSSREPRLPYSETQSSDWRTELEKNLSRQYPGPQIHLHHLIGETSHVLLGLNHAVVDGLSSLQLARDLLHLYSGDEVKALPHGPGVESRFPKGFRGLRGWWRAIRFIFVLAKMGPALQIGGAEPTRNTGSVGFRFGSTKALNDEAREKGSNFFALFSAIVLRSVQEIYATDGQALRLSLNTPVSLRPFTNVPKNEIGVFLAGHLGLYEVNLEKDLFELARECSIALKQGVSEGRPLHLTRLARGARKAKAPKIPTQVSTHRPTVSISNLGRVEDFPQAGGARVEELHAVSAQSMKDPFAFVLTSYGEETFVDLQFSREKLSRDEALRLLEAVRQNLAFLSTNS